MINEECIEFLPEHELPQKAKEFGQNPEEKATDDPTTTATAASSGAPSSKSVPLFPESAVNTLTAMGVSRAEAIQALDAANGNIDLAVGLLFA